MTQIHPELAAEQAVLDEAYERLEASRDDALRLKDMVEVGRGGTNQARWEREVFYENIAERLRELDLGDRSLCFGRIDQTEDAGGGSYRIGRIAVASADREPLVVDWRAPVAEAFYRATGVNPHGLVRRRHFVTRGRKLIDLEDEFFGEAATNKRVMINGRELRGEGALVRALEENRTGRLGDIIGTIQAEQDEIIRASMAGVLVCQGGPGTGKTVVALHRAAYLLYTYRFPLEGEGVLVVGPNRLFLGYVEQVLPSLGEAGAEMAVLADLVPGITAAGRDGVETARTKGDIRMLDLLERALALRQRPARSDLVINIGTRKVRVPAARTAQIIRDARRRFYKHNRARKFVQTALFELIAEYHPDKPDPRSIDGQLKANPEVREALLWMWPALSPAEFLHDLLGSKSMLAAAGAGLFEPFEVDSLYRKWRPEMNASKATWTLDDVPLLDEALELLGSKSRNKQRAKRDEVRTYGHIVVDEAQDLSPMQLTMLTRRSLSGSMTIVGDIAQSTGAWAHDSWDEVLEYLPDRKPSTLRELTVGYRIPGPSMELAARILAVAAPELKAPTAVRSEGDPPEIIEHETYATLGKRLIKLVNAEAEEASGNIAVICPNSLYEFVVASLRDGPRRFGAALTDGLREQVTVVPVQVVKGLEVDTAIVVEPNKIMAEEPQGARSLYVACTRATKRLKIVYVSEPEGAGLPDVLR